MKNYILLVSLLALTACAGNSPTTAYYYPDQTNVVPENWSKDANSELSDKIYTIKYVEDKLGSILGNNKELTSGYKTSRSATTNKIEQGQMTYDEIEKRYAYAMTYFDIVKDILSASAGDTFSVKEIKIAYSLMSGKKYENISAEDTFKLGIYNFNDNETISLNDITANNLQNVLESCSFYKTRIASDLVKDIENIVQNNNNSNNSENTQNGNSQNGDNQNSNNQNGDNQNGNDNSNNNGQNEENSGNSESGENNNGGNSENNQNNNNENGNNQSNNDYEENNPILIPDSTNILNPDMLANLKDMSGDLAIYDDINFRFDENGNLVALDIFDDSDWGLTLNRQGNTNRFALSNAVWYFDFVACNDSYCLPLSLDELPYKYEDRTQLAQLVREKLSLDGNFSSDNIDTVCNTIINDANYGEWLSTDWAGSLTSLGHRNGLKYADFGYYKMDIFDYSFVYDTGIAQKRVNVTPETLPEDITFRGSAVAQLQKNIEVAANVETENRLITTPENAATFTLHTNGKETLYLPFNNWYSVYVEKDSFNIHNIDFINNGTVEGDWRVNRENITYDNSYGYNTNSYAESSINGGIISYSTTMNEKYYGEDYNDPTEATVFLNHVDVVQSFDENGQAEMKEVWFDAMFGGKK